VGQQDDPGDQENHRHQQRRGQAGDARQRPRLQSVHPRLGSRQQEVSVTEEGKEPTQDGHHQQEQREQADPRKDGDHQLRPRAAFGCRRVGVSVDGDGVGGEEKGLRGHHPGGALPQKIGLTINLSPEQQLEGGVAQQVLAGLGVGERGGRQGRLQS
jgi:hypothetical protein